MHSKYTTSLSPTNVTRIALFCLFILGLYYSTFIWLVMKDWAREDFGHCYFMPFVVAYLIWDRKAAFLSCPTKPSWVGFFPLCLGIAMFWLGDLGGEYLLLYLSCWMVVIGVLWVHIGWKKLKTIAFALFMSLTMFPLPHFIYNKISVKLQLLSSKIGVSLMQFYGMSVHREGNIIDLGFTKLQVVEACSGLRSLMSLVVLGLLMAYFFRSNLWKRALFLIFVIPVAIGANSIRLALTGIVYEAWGREAAEGFFHGFSGWVIFCFALGVLLAVMWMLKKMGNADITEKKGRNPENVYTIKQSEFDAATHQRSDGSPIGNFLQRHTIATFALLIVTLVISHGIEFRERIPIIRPLDAFPLKMEKWTGIRHTMDQYYIDALDLSDYVIVDYYNKTGKKINLYVAYYESQSKGKFIHTPATCLPGSGWSFRQTGRIEIETQLLNGVSIQVNRAYMEKMNQAQLSYYWFLQRGRILNNAYQLKWYAFWDALTKQRTDGALVRLIAPISGSDSLEQVEARLRSFTRQIVPLLQEFIPGKEI